jgi:hypothetical protein
MNFYRFITAASGALLTSALALASLGGCNETEPSSKTGSAVDRLDGCTPGQEYTDGNGNTVLCGAGGEWEVEVPIPPDEPPTCEQLPGGCFPWEPPDPPEPPPTDPGGGGDPPPEPPPGNPPTTTNCPAPEQSRGCSNAEISHMQSQCQTSCSYYGVGSNGLHECTFKTITRYDGSVISLADVQCACQGMPGSGIGISREFTCSLATRLGMVGLRRTACARRRANHRSPGGRRRRFGSIGRRRLPLVPPCSVRRYTV